MIGIVSGGQTGVDRGAMDAALASGVPCGGWCPAGRWAEDGPIPPRYPLRQTPSANPAQRTRWNVRDADATLILHRGTPLTGGTALAGQWAERYGKALRVEAVRRADLGGVRRWLAANGVRLLNVAGPRQSEAPGIQQQAFHVVRALLVGHSASRWRVR